MLPYIFVPTSTVLHSKAVSDKLQFSLPSPVLNLKAAMPVLPIKAVSPNLQFCPALTSAIFEGCPKAASANLQFFSALTNATYKGCQCYTTVLPWPHQHQTVPNSAAGAWSRYQSLHFRNTNHTWPSAVAAPQQTTQTAGLTTNFF